MEMKNFCQSCSMPLHEPALWGTEKDGSASREYCKYCYQRGAFTNPDMTLDEMRKLVINKMEEKKIPSGIIKKAVSQLPLLKRWKNTALAVV